MLYLFLLIAKFFGLKTYRNFNDELKYEIDKNAMEDMIYFKKIVESLSTSTKEREKG